MMNTILQILADNARLTNEQLAAMTGKTTVEVAQEIDPSPAGGNHQGL